MKASKPFKKFKDPSTNVRKRKKRPSKPYVTPRPLARRNYVRKLLRAAKRRNTSQINMKTERIDHRTSKDSHTTDSIILKDEPFDGDCICIDPEPEIIVIDDETLVTGNSTETNIEIFNTCVKNESLPLSNGESMNMHTSTPKFSSRRNNMPTKPPLYKCDNDAVMGSHTIGNLPEDETSNDVVIIEDTSSPKNSSKTKKNVDDSVIFICEIPGINLSQMDFIPLESNPSKTPEPTERVRRSPRIRNSELLNSVDKKELELYNVNTYNPDKDAPQKLTKKRMVLVDGSNVAFSHALSKEFSVKGVQICLEYFEKMGHEVKAIVPQFRLQKSSDPQAMQKLHSDGKLVITPSKSILGKSTSPYDDRFILQLATELDAAIVSNDNYRDLIRENTAFKKIIENRVIGYTWCNDIFIIPKDPYGRWGPSLTCILNRA